MFYILEKNGNILLLNNKLLIFIDKAEAEGMSEGHTIKTIYRNDLDNLLPIYNYSMIIVEDGKTKNYEIKKIKEKYVY